MIKGGKKEFDLVWIMRTVLPWLTLRPVLAVLPVLFLGSVTRPQARSGLLLWLSLLLFCSGCVQSSKINKHKSFTFHRGATIRGDSATNQLALVFTGDEFAEGGEKILAALQQHSVKASFFLTGRFYRDPDFADLIRRIRQQGHYLGAHSDEHLLYCDWVKRDSLLVTKQQFTDDLLQNYRRMEEFGVNKRDAEYFLPPYEWFNDSISAWTRELGLQLINYTPGTRSHADYTTPVMKNYVSATAIIQSIHDYEKKNTSGLNGFILLMHIGAGPQRKDPLHDHLGDLITALKEKKYSMVRVDELLKH